MIRYGSAVIRWPSCQIQWVSMAVMSPGAAAAVSSGDRQQMMSEPEEHTELRRAPLIVLAGIDDLEDQPSVWLSLGDALHLLDHLPPLINRRGQELIQPRNSYRV
jgi:hypothetical protein